jgi:hypothetical protein
MRVNLIIQSLKLSRSLPGTIPLSLTIRPACGIPGDYECRTDSTSLLRMLNKQTDLPESVLYRFERGLYECHSSKLMGVELSESLLTDIGYFVD